MKMLLVSISRNCMFCDFRYCRITWMTFMGRRSLSRAPRWRFQGCGHEVHAQPCRWPILTTVVIWTIWTEVRLRNILYLFMKETKWSSVSYGLMQTLKFFRGFDARPGLTNFFQHRLAQSDIYIFIKILLISFR